MAESVNFKNTSGDPSFDNYLFNNHARFDPLSKSESSEPFKKDITESLSRKEKDDIINQLLEKYGAKPRLQSTTTNSELSNTTPIVNFSTSSEFNLRGSQTFQNINTPSEPKIELATSQYLSQYQNWNERFEFEKSPPYQPIKNENNIPSNILLTQSINSQSSSPNRNINIAPTTSLGPLVYERNPLVEQIIREEKEKRYLSDSKPISSRSGSINNSPIENTKFEKYDNFEQSKDTSIKQRFLLQEEKRDIVEKPVITKSYSKENIITPSYPSSNKPGKNGFKIVGVLMLILIFRLFIILYLDI